MKQGRTLAELAAELDRQHRTKHDYLADTRKIEITVADGKPVMSLAADGQRPLAIRDIAHNQIAEHTSIPRPYYDRMRKEAPELLATNVRKWFDKYPAVRLVRELDTGCRAFLSDAYRPLDNYDFAQVILGSCAQRKLEVMSCEVTERKLYIKAVDERLYRDVPVGYKMGDGSHRIFDTCAPVSIATNSEVGFGRLTLETGVYTRACTNLCLWSDGGMKRTHLGSRHKVNELTGVENIDHLLTDRTKAKSDEALWLQLRDVLAASFEPERIGKRLEKLAATAENKITGKVPEVVERVAERLGLTEGEQDNVLRHLIEGGSLTQYGLHAAITRSAQDAESYDRATELEYAGGKVVELARTEWEALAA
jgi:hypothetical protein